MNTLKDNKIIFYFTSLFIHVCFLGMMVFYFDSSREKLVLGERVVHSYFYQNNIKKSERVVENKTMEIKKIEEKVVETEMAEKKIAEKKEIITKKTLASKKSVIKKTAKLEAQPERQTSIAIRTQGVQTQELLALLHAAIQDQQRYPASAMEMERQGKVTVQFYLSMDGKINDLHIIKSSGTESLDMAALAAVRNAAPFNKINKYLQEPQEFSIDVVFELA